jgi:hypothetical protein
MGIKIPNWRKKKRKFLVTSNCADGIPVVSLPSSFMHIRAMTITSQYSTVVSIQLQSALHLHGESGIHHHI